MLIAMTIFNRTCSDKSPVLETDGFKDVNDF